MKTNEFRMKNKNTSLKININIQEMSQETWIVYLKDSFINQKFVKICGKNLVVMDYSISQDTKYFGCIPCIKYEFRFNDGSTMIFQEN